MNIPKDKQFLQLNAKEIAYLRKLPAIGNATYNHTSSEIEKARRHLQDVFPDCTVQTAFAVKMLLLYELHVRKPSYNQNEQKGKYSAELPALTTGIKMRQLTNVNEISPTMFEDVVVYSVAEPGAMGAPCRMEFIPRNGNPFCLTYGSKITYDMVKICFPALDDCIWNGPMPNELTNPGEVVFFPVNNDTNVTRVAKSWVHTYMGCGNHLLVKKEYFPIFCKYIEDLKQPVDIFCEWQNRLEGFLAEINK